MRERLIYAFGTVGSLLLIYNLYIILLRMPDEAAQGAIFRIMFYHIPAFFTAGICYMLALIGSSMYLIKKKGIWDALAVSATEVGLVFAAVNLITGMFWGRIIWGIWWAWDPRLTWALICWLVYFGYMMLRRAIDDPTERAKIAGVLSIFAFVSVTITWKAIEWWRTQHPGPVLSFRTNGEQRVDPMIEHMIYQNWWALLLIAAVFLMIRMRQEQTQREIDAMRRQAHAL
jgi:heme exporter protein C